MLKTEEMANKMTGIERAFVDVSALERLAVGPTPALAHALEQVSRFEDMKEKYDKQYEVNHRPAVR